MVGASRPASEASQVGRSAPKATPGNRLETAQQMAAHAKARAHRTLDRRNVEGQGAAALPGADGRALLRFGADRVRGGDRRANLGAGHRIAQRWTVELATNQRSACER